MAAVKPKSQVAFQLDEIFPSSGESSRIATPYASQHATPGPSRPPSPSSGRRVFEVQQPPPAQSKAARWLLMTLIVNANLVQMISNNVTVAGGYSLTAALGRDTSTANWMAAAYPLTQGAFVMVSGRLGQIYGHQHALLAGGLIFTVFSLANGFATNYEAFITMRALSGIGGGLIMPNGVALITTTVPPGMVRNVTMGFFAASAPIGGWFGALLAGIFTQYTEWKWVFFFLAMFSAITFVPLVFLFPKEHPMDKGGKIDFLGAFLGLGSLLLFSFVWNQAPSVGWQTPYVIACLILSIVMFAAFTVWESHVENPIMPLGLFKAPTFSALVAVVLFNYMAYSIFQWYMIAWQQLVRGWSIVNIAVGWLPFLVGSLVSVWLAAWLLPRVPAQHIMAMGLLVIAVPDLLLATQPAQQTYWAQTFPAITLSSLCPDFVYVAAQIIASNSVGRRQQGIAGSLMGTLNLYGSSLGVGFAGTIESQVRRYPGADAVLGYRAALYFGFALAVVGLAIDLIFVRMPKDVREGWDPEDEADDTDSVEVRVVTGAVNPEVPRSAV